MEPVFLNAGLDHVKGGIGTGKTSWGYWYGEGPFLDIPRVGRVKLNRVLRRPSLSPLDKGEWRRILSLPGPPRFFKALKAYHEGNHLEALVYLQTCQELPEVWALMGFIMLLQDKPKGAISFFETYLAEGKEREILDGMGLVPYLTCDIGLGVEMGVTISHRGIRALLARCYRGLGHLDGARGALERLAFAGKDPFVILELVELFFAQGEYDRVVDLVHDLVNDTPLHTLTLLYLAMSLEALGALRVALMAYNAAIRRRKDRDPHLIKLIRYRRLLLYQKMGRGRRYRQEVLRLWEEDPHYQDIDARVVEVL